MHFCPSVPKIATCHVQGFIQDFFVGGGERGHWPVVLSQMLLFEMCSFLIKCIDEKTKRLSSQRMMLYITKS